MTCVFEAIVAEAALAPSVHNVQPARWRVVGDHLDLHEDNTRRLPVGDPQGRDTAISLGAAIEGASLAAARRGLRLVAQGPPPALGVAHLRAIARFAVQPAGCDPDPLAQWVHQRRSWRAAFAPATSADHAAATALGASDLAILSDRAVLAQAARLADTASHAFLRNQAYRAELVSWMRLSRRHPRWGLDGLNAEALAMSGLAAAGAGVVLGPAFVALDAVGLARPLVGEGTRIADSAALAVFHRPVAEPALDSGRHFYRAWLRIEAAGLGAHVYAALADDPKAAAIVARWCGLGPGQRVISCLRIGRRPARTPALSRARLPLDAVLLRGA
jgi:nitroreductase